MTQEELLARREVAGKAYRFAAERWGAFDAAGEAAYLDREFPLPAPEPKGVTGPSGQWYQMQEGASYVNKIGPLSELWVVVTRAHGTQGVELRLPKEDRATVANLLVPFEDVVRATLDHMGVVNIEGRSAGWRSSNDSFCATVARSIPAILKRLESAK